MAIIHCSLVVKTNIFSYINLEQNKKADFIAAPFRRDLPRARRSQSRNEIIARAVVHNYENSTKINISANIKLLVF